MKCLWMTLPFLLLGLAFAAELDSVPSRSYLKKLDSLERTLPAGSGEIRLTIAEARALAESAESLRAKNPKSPRLASKDSACQLYWRIIENQMASQKNRLAIEEKRQKQTAWHMVCILSRALYSRPGRLCTRRHFLLSYKPVPEKIP